MSQADLLKLRALYPGIPAQEWAELFGWQWRAPAIQSEDEQQKPPGGSYTHEPSDEGSKAEHGVGQPDDIRQWYLSRCESRKPMVEPLSTASLAPEATGPLKPVFVPQFESTAAWRSALDSILACNTSGAELDIAASVNHIAQCRPLHQLPRCRRMRYSASTLVIVDQRPELRPLRDWQGLVLGLIRATVGEPSFDYKVLHEAPLESESRLQLLAKAEGVDRVIVLRTQDERWCAENIQAAWDQLAEELRDCGQDLITLQPTLNALNQTIVYQVLVSAACLTYPRVEQLAALVQVFGGGLAELLAVWNHAHLQYPSAFFQLQSDYRDTYRESFGDISPEHQTVVNAVNTEFRALKPACQIVMESLLSAASDREAMPSASWVASLVGSIRATSTEAGQAYFNGLASEYAEIHAAFRSSPAMSELFDVVDPIHSPEKGQEQARKNYYLLGHQYGLRILDRPHPFSIAVSETPWKAEDGRQLAAGDFPGLAERTLLSDTHQFTVTPLQKPTWAEHFHRTANGNLEAVHADGARFELIPASADQPQSIWQPAGGLWPWAKQAGIDEHGLWATLAVNAASYRLRWIPPGTFMMGSPENEPNRRDNEQQHQVTLSQGYWLGETTVTQALWHAVTGTNPSTREQTGPAPWNSSSWDDCNAFIIKMREVLPMFDARLPTEAQWEYACRADTQTPYWWGNEMSAEHGNNGDKLQIETPYPANDFGLKSMHGNLLEWCQDWYSEYPKDHQTDPTGPQKGQYRVLRGGSWSNGPQNLRSASRDHGTPGRRFRFGGFRLAGGFDPQAGKRRGAAQTADRDEGTEEQRGGQGRSSPDKNT